jgi:hypothetical protein
MLSKNLKLLAFLSFTVELTLSQKQEPSYIQRLMQAATPDAPATTPENNVFKDA